MPGSVRNNQYSCPSQACQANQKAGGDKRSRAAVLRTKWSTSGGQRRGPGHRVQPKWTIVLYLQVHTAPNCGPSDTPQHPPTSHTYKSHVYLHQPSKPLNHSCSPSSGGWDLVVFFREEEKILLLATDGWNVSGIPIHPFSSQRQTARRTLHVQPPKHSTGHNSLTGCRKQVCILIFSAPIH